MAKNIIETMKIADSTFMEVQKVDWQSYCRLQVNGKFETGSARFSSVKLTTSTHATPLMTLMSHT